jgi:hypothetical protein
MRLWCFVTSDMRLQHITIYEYRRQNGKERIYVMYFQLLHCCNHWIEVEGRHFDTTIPSPCVGPTALQHVRSLAIYGYRSANVTDSHD